MKPLPEQEISKVLSDFSPEDVESVVTLVKSICRERALGARPAELELSDAEHVRICSVLDSVAGLSLETGAAVSNRDHDKYLHGR